MVFAQDRDVLMHEVLDSLEKQKNEVLHNELIKTDDSRDSNVYKEIDFFLEETQQDQTKIDMTEASRKTLIEELDFQDADIADVLETIEKKTGFELQANGQISGTLSFDIQNVSIWDALRIICEPNDLAYFQKNGIIKIMTKYDYQTEFRHDFNEKEQTKIIQLHHVDQEDWIAKLNSLKSEEGRIFSDGRANALILIDTKENLKKMKKFIESIDKPLETEVFEIKFARLEDIKKEIMNIISEEIGSVESNEASNKVVVTDTLEKINEVANFIKEVDVKIDVSVKAEIYQIRLNEAHEEGVDWEAIVSNYQKLDLITQGSIPKNKPLSIGTITDEDYDVLLEALDTVGEVNRIVSFSGTAVANQETGISLGTKGNVKESKIKSHIKKLVLISQKFDRNEIDIQMKIVSKLDKDRNLIINILPELRWVLSNVISSQEREEEVFLSNEKLDVGIKNNETIVIGGISQEKEVSKVRRVPLLGNLPFVGFVFRRQNKFYEKTEYVVFLTPRISE